MRIVSRIASVQLVVAMLALVVMGSVTVADVVLKYLFSQPIAGAYDVVESLLPVVIFNGLPATLLRRQNIAIDLVDHLAGPRRTRLLIAAADLVMLAMLALITWAMVAPALQAMEYGDRKLELGLPVWVVWTGALIGMAGSVLVALALVVRPPPAAGRTG
jgi:TRAP-type C4-dicarboxylate transport system permease small subunit